MALPVCRMGPKSLPQARLVPHHLQSRDDPVGVVSCILNVFSNIQHCYQTVNTFRALLGTRHAYECQCMNTSVQTPCVSNQVIMSRMNWSTPPVFPDAFTSFTGTTLHFWHFRFSQPQCWRLQSSGMWWHVTVHAAIDFRTIVVPLKCSDNWPTNTVSQ